MVSFCDKASGGPKLMTLQKRDYNTEQKPVPSKLQSQRRRKASDVLKVDEHIHSDTSSYLKDIFEKSY